MKANCEVQSKYLFIPGTFEGILTELEGNTMEQSISLSFENQPFDRPIDPLKFGRIFCFKRTALSGRAFPTNQCISQQNMYVYGDQSCVRGLLTSTILCDSLIACCSFTIPATSAPRSSTFKQAV